jgi:hypothetical protein
VEAVRTETLFIKCIYIVSDGMSHEFLLDDEKMGEGSGESSMDVDLSIFQEQLKSRNLDLKKLDRIVNHLKKQDRDLSVSININILLNVYSQINDCYYGSDN